MRFRVEVLVSGFRVWGLGFRVQGQWLGVEGFGVEGVLDWVRRLRQRRLFIAAHVSYVNKSYRFPVTLHELPDFHHPVA